MDPAILFQWTPHSQSYAEQGTTQVLVFYSNGRPLELSLRDRNLQQFLCS